MTYTLYTIDRQGTLTPDLELGFVSTDSIEPEPVRRQAAVWFPRGVSAWGVRLVLEPAHVTVLDVATELTCELVRRAEFPAAPSRFECVFGSATLEDALRLRPILGVPEARVFKLEGPAPPFRGDMQALNVRGSLLATMFGARRYWSGKPAAVDASPPLLDPGPPIWEHVLPLPARVIERVV